MPSRTVTLALACGLSLCACPELPPGPEDSGGGEPLWPAGTVEFGVPVSEEDFAFQPMPASLELHPGAQGGFHVPVSYRVGRSEPGATFEHRVRRVRDGVLVSRGTREFDVEAPSDGGAWTADFPVVVFLCPTPVGVNVVDEELTFEVTVTREGGVLLGRGTAKAVARCPSANASFCNSICKG
jgi:hypothetical protein